MRTTGQHWMGSLRKGSPRDATFVTELIIHQFWGARDRSGQAYGEPARGPTRRSHRLGCPRSPSRVLAWVLSLTWVGAATQQQLQERPRSRPRSAPRPRKPRPCFASDVSVRFRVASAPTGLPRMAHGAPQLWQFSREWISTDSPSSVDCAIVKWIGLLLGLDCSSSIPNWHSGRLRAALFSLAALKEPALNQDCNLVGFYSN